MPKRAVVASDTEVGLIVDISDLHSGSVLGLQPPKVILRSGNALLHENNLHQVYLWDAYCRLTAQVLEYCAGDPFGLVLNGDMTEGSHHRNDLEILADEHQHKAIAKATLAQLLKHAAWVAGTEGTDCHTKDFEHRLLAELAREGHKVIKPEGPPEYWAAEKWIFEVNGVVYDVAHHMGVTSRAYLEASAMSISMGNAWINKLRAGHRAAQVFLRAHRHCHGFYSDGFGIFGVTGGWPFLNRNARKKVGESIPRPSILVLDHRRLRPGELPTIKQFVANPPEGIIPKFK